MLPVSATWHEASRAQFRYQAYVRAALKLEPPGLRQNAVVTTSDSFQNADVHKVINTNIEQPAMWTTLEPNRWLLNGTSQFITTNVQFDDWWSDTPPSPEDPVILHFEFDKAYSIQIIQIYWDILSGAYPTDFDIITRDVNDEIIQVDNFTDTTSAMEQLYTLKVDDVKFLDLRINEWSLPQWRVRITEVMFGVFINFDSINNGRISKVSWIRRVSLVGEELPAYSMDISFQNLDKYFDPMLQRGTSKYLAAQQLFTVQWGFVVAPGTVEWTAELPLFIDTFSIPKDSSDVSMHLVNRLDLLSAEYKTGSNFATNRTFKDVALDVLENSNVLKTVEDQIPWILPDFLQEYETSAPTPALASNQILQLIAQASCSILCVDGSTGFITFKQLQDEANQFDSITQTQELGNPGVEVVDRLRSITFNIYSYSIATETTEVGKSKYVLQDTTQLVVKYSANYAADVSATITGGTLVSATYYSSYALLTVSIEDTEPKQVEITLQGKVINKVSTLVETYKNVNVSNGADIVVENPFITSTDKLPQQSEYIRRYYSKRTKYTLPYLGYVQLEPGDKIHLETIYGEDDVDVISNNIEFNGGWTGTAEVI